jgi:glycosyltransferase involved in cell wall biosynthesis
MNTDKADKGDVSKNIGTIASAGGISYRKGIDQIIMAIQKLPKEYQLYIAGKETQESQRLRSLSKKLNVEDRINFLGYISNMDTFICDMDMFVVGSRSEGFPLSLQEIVSYQKPVVCSNLPIFREIFTPDEVVFFEIDHIDNLAKSIQGCYNKREALVNKAYKKFTGNYTSMVMAKKYLDIYREIKQ